MEIRQAKPEDFDNIYDLVKIAFQTANVSDGTEQDFVISLRSSENYIPELELIAIDKGVIVGHIMLTKQTVITDQGEYMGLLVAPLCVKLEERGKGIPNLFMQEGFKRAKQIGYTAAFLIGDPHYYHRFGFEQTSTFGIQNVTEIPDECVLGCEIVKDSLTHITGTIAII